MELDYNFATELLNKYSILCTSNRLKLFFLPIMELSFPIQVNIQSLLHHESNTKLQRMLKYKTEAILNCTLLM